MNKQEAFDKAVTGVVAQGKKSTSDSNFNCRYRGDNGCKCVVGHLIPDDEYVPDMEGKGISQIIYNNFCPTLDRFADGFESRIHALTFLSELQWCHDSAYDPNFLSSFKEKAITFAANFELTIPSCLQ